MKRWLLAGVTLLILSIAFVYFLIPSHLIVSKIVLLNCNRDGADRVLGDTRGWARWWPPAGTNGPNRDGGRLLYREVGYQVSERLRRGAVIMINDNGREIASSLSIFPLSTIDSSYVQWQFVQHASLNPLKRIGQYQQAKRLKTDMGVILDSLRRFLNDRENVYGVVIAEGGTKDSFLVQTTRTVKRYPGTRDIYETVKTLETFARVNGGKRTGYPMVNIDSLSGGQFAMKIAIPVDRKMMDNGHFESRKLVNGKYLETDVRGGPGAINAALHRIDNYIADYRRTVMAIPFFSLVTDRASEPDSTKWMTRIYYPIY